MSRVLLDRPHMGEDVFGGCWHEEAALVCYGRGGDGSSEGCYVSFGALSG